MSDKQYESKPTPSLTRWRACSTIAGAGGILGAGVGVAIWMRLPFWLMDRASPEFTLALGRNLTIGLLIVGVVCGWAGALWLYDREYKQ